MGLKDLRKHIVFEHVWTPLDIRAQYNSNKGSIYGVVSDRWKNLAFKAPKQSTLYPNLFFVGGTGESRRRDADGRAVRPERRQKNCRVGQVMILLLVTLAQWAAGFLVLGRVRDCNEANASSPVSGGQLSVIIPARNEETNLPNLLRSLATQSVRPKEIIVVDDASTDNTAEVAASKRCAGRQFASAAGGMARQDVGVSSRRAGRSGAKIIIPRCRHLVRAGWAGARARGISSRRRWRALRCALSCDPQFSRAVLRLLQLGDAGRHGSFYVLGDRYPQRGLARPVSAD